MGRSCKFTFRVGASERQMIATLAHRLQRSQGDAVRILIREAVSTLSSGDHTVTSGGVLDSTTPAIAESEEK